MNYESLLSPFPGVALVVVGFMILFAGLLSTPKNPETRHKQTSVMLLLGVISLTTGFFLVTAPR